MAILVIIFLCISCTDNAELPVKPDKNEGTENVLIELAVTVPAVTYTRTRGIVRTIDHETLINEIQILVFEEGKYKYRVPGLSINNTASTITFTALLKSGDIPMKLLILANATDVVVADEPVVGDSEEMIKKKMNRKFDYLTSVFPMSGEYELPEGLKPTGTGTILGLKMLRSIARVDVTATEVANFRMTGVKAYRANNYLQVIPDETGVSKVTFPSVPEGSDRNVDSSIFPVSSENWNNFSARLYLSETWSPEPADQVDKATCIVVEGYYADSNTPSYYRMDFDPDNNHNAFGQVLRNHKYIFNIKKVSAPGWSTPDDAAHNRSSNIVAEVQAWDDDTMDMYFDGEHHFGISTREVVLKHKTGSEGIISVSTDLLDYTLQWADDAGVLQGTGAQSLSNDYFTVTKEDNGSRLVITALQNNLADGSNRIQHFVITAQRWTIYVSIQQKYDIAAYKTINLMSFTSGLGYLGTNILGSSSAEARATGLRGILTNQTNFGPDGVVECGGYNLVGVGVNANNLTDALFSLFDVVYINYVPTSQFGSQDAHKLHNWLKTKKNRVLIASYDASDVSQNLLAEILAGKSGIKYFTSNGGPYPLAASTIGNHYFTTDGPFTKNAPVTSNFALRNYDIYHGEIQVNTSASEGITPILMGPGGGIVLGIDYSRRIVYWGDTDMSSNLSGTGATSENHINNTAGTINNDASKLIANVFAWINRIIWGMSIVMCSPYTVSVTFLYIF